MSVTKVTGMMQTSTKGGDIPSAGTMVIDTDGDYFDITGTTGITGMTVAAGRRFTLQFDGAVAITDNAAITLSGAASFTTAAGDILSFIAVAADTVVQTGYSLVDGGSPVAASAGPTDSKFLVYATASQDNCTGGGTTYTITWDTEIFDTGSDFTQGTPDAFVAPETGKYLLSAHLVITGLAVNTQTYSMFNIVTSNRTYTTKQVRTAHTAGWDNNHNEDITAVADMDACDTAYVTILISGPGDVGDIHASYTIFSGALLA